MLDNEIREADHRTSDLEFQEYEFVHETQLDLRLSKDGLWSAQVGEKTATCNDLHCAVARAVEWHLTKNITDDHFVREGQSDHAQNSEESDNHE